MLRKVPLGTGNQGSADVFRLNVAGMTDLLGADAGNLDRATPLNITSISPAMLKRYPGFYAPHDGEFGLYAITQNEGRLSMQISGQPALEFYPTRNGVRDAARGFAGRLRATWVRCVPSSSKASAARAGTCTTCIASAARVAGGLRSAPTKVLGALATVTSPLTLGP